ncbi:hypothetical protein FRB99_004332 [Tulasnella sp. 403]|nr:hypothetical protein FRB99_004332 [Tulasnella sp. 403]
MPVPSTDSQPKQMSNRPLLSLALDTSPATLQIPSNPDNQQPNSPRSRWSPSSPSRLPASPIDRLRQSLSSAISPVTSTFRRRQSHQRKSDVSRPGDAESFPTENIPLVVTQSGDVTPLERFRRAGHQVIQMNRLRRAMLAGDDQGMDVRRPSILTRALSFDVRQEKCIVDVIDYTQLHEKSYRIANAELPSFLAESRRPSAKHVRWINVAGLSYDVVSTLALEYDLHPLSVEDIFQQQLQLSRSKVDYYPQHVFIRLLAHLPPRPGGESVCQSKDGTGDVPSGILSHLGLDHTKADTGKEFQALKSLASVGLSGAQPWAPNQPSSFPLAREVYPELQPIDVKRNPSDLKKMFSLMTPDQRARAADRALVETLKRGRRVQVRKQNVFIFLRRDGTVLSFHPSALEGFFDSIMRRIRRRKSNLRSKPDGSLLVHALIDHVVDCALGLIDEYTDQMLAFERDILMNPKTSLMRDLHIVSADLKMVRMTLRPMQIVIRTLRKLDSQKSIALTEDEQYARKNKRAIQGFMSGDAKIYLVRSVYQRLRCCLTTAASSRRNQ